MHAARFCPQIGLQLREDGTTMGTVQQFVARLELSASQIRACLRTHDALVAQVGTGRTQLFIVRARGMTALRRRAAHASDSCSP